MADPRRESGPAPTVQELWRATGVALVVAAVVTVVAVLPAELALDPTGLGTRLGLTALGELKQAGNGPAPEPATPAEPTFQSGGVSVTLAPGRGTEVKASLRAGDQLVFSWTTDGGAVFYDFHGEPEGAAPDVFTSYETGTAVAAEGALDAPFTGVHGWYWKNRSPQPVTVTLQATGVYADLSQLH